MATELRRIIFSNAEVIEAIKSYNEVVKKKLPDVAIVSCRIDAASMNPTLEMRHHATAKHYKVTLKRSVIGAALMKWCLDNRIPMARGAEKKLEVVGDNLSIAMTMNLRAEDLVEDDDGTDQFSELEKKIEAVAVA